MCTWLSVWAIILCGLTSYSPAWAAHYEVAQQNPTASDDAPGTLEKPWKTLAKAAAMVRPGDVVTVRDGIYREQVVVRASGTSQAPIRFEAAPGAQVVVTGADQLAGWQRTEEARPIFRVAWPHRFVAWNPSMTHPADPYHRIIGRCEQVFVNGYPLRQVLDAAQLAPGAFFVDISARALLVWESGGRDLNQTCVEASVRQEILRLDGDFLHVRGFHFRYAANMAQRGAVLLAGRYDGMEDCIVEEMNSSGAAFTGEDAVVRRCVFRNNGQLGFGASRAHRLLFTECLVENNNTKNFDRGWEAGGDKLVLCREAVLERSRFVRNRGNGIWFDIGNTNCVVRNCLIADNEDAGIFYEISFGLHAQDNVITGNGFAPTAGGWGAQAGISLSSSPGCVIERNIIFGNREGFNFREQRRTTPTIEDEKERAVWNHDELIRHNLITHNRDAQVWGWFDVDDNRHWPNRAPATNQSASAKPGDIAAAYLAATSAGQPQGLVLEQLRLQFENNVFWAAPGGGWFKWGPGWARHRAYPGLAEFRADLHLDTGGRVRDPEFLDVRQRDFRVRPEAMVLLKDNYPQGEVPGVRLGVP